MVMLPPSERVTSATWAKAASAASMLTGWPSTLNTVVATVCVGKSSTKKSGSTKAGGIGVVPPPVSPPPVSPPSAPVSELPPHAASVTAMKLSAPMFLALFVFRLSHAFINRAKAALGCLLALSVTSNTGVAVAVCPLATMEFM